MKKLATIVLAGLLMGLGGPGSARADDFPVKSIRIIVPFPAGGTTVVENRAGASGTIGSELVARSAADGGVLLLTATHHVINPSLFRKLPYDTRKDFSPIAVVATAPNALFVNKDFPAKTVAELVAMAKNDPGKLSFGS